MTKNILSGEEALDALAAATAESDETPSNEFTRLSSGTSFTVKVPGMALISAFVYSNFENPRINSFVAENESKKSAKGFPVEELTPFDKAWKHYKDQSDHYQDEMAGKAQVYKADHKFTIGFFDLDTGEPMKVEFTKNQASVIVGAIKKNEKYLDKFAFELAKNGKGRDTTVSLTLIPMLDELDDTQRKNFEELPSEFDPADFEGLHFLKSDEEMIKQLSEVGFDISLIGLELPEEDSKAAGNDGPGSGENGELLDEDLPF